MFAADLAVLNANVVTFNPKRPRAQALAVKDGKIVALGPNDEVGGYVDGETRVVDVKGKTVVPGFVDCHAHMTGFGRQLQALDLHDACAKACQKAVEEGLTGVHWIVDSSEELRIIQKLRREGKLPLRVYVGVPAKLLDEAVRLGLSTGFGDDVLKLGFVKVFADGFLRTGTAALKEPYSDKPETRGIMHLSQRKLNSLVLKAHRAGWQLAVHAVGDRAIEAVLKAFSNAFKKCPDVSHRHRVEHCSVLNPQLVRRMKRLGLVASIQPHFIVSNFWVVERVGADKARWVYPFKTLMKTGITVVSGSDCPYEPISPLLGVWAAAVARPIFKEESLTVEEALKTYTVNAAYASFDEDKKGTIEVGKLADFTVLSEDPFKVPPDKIREIKVEMTVVGGRIVYEKR